MTRRMITPQQADALFRLPPGLVSAWVTAGHLSTSLYVSRGRIVRGVPLADVTALVDARRATAIARARAGTGALCS